MDAARWNIIILAHLLINLRVPDVSVLITSCSAASGDTQVTRLLTAALRAVKLNHSHDRSVVIAAATLLCDGRQAYQHNVARTPSRRRSDLHWLPFIVCFPRCYASPCAIDSM